MLGGGSQSILLGSPALSSLLFEAIFRGDDAQGVGPHTTAAVAAGRTPPDPLADSGHLRAGHTLGDCLADTGVPYFGGKRYARLGGTRAG